MLGAFPLALRVGAGGAAVGPGGEGAERGARGDRRRRRGRAGGRRLGAAQGLPAGDVRLALLRRLAQPLVELVLDAGLRRPGEGARVPAPSRAAVVTGARYVVWPRAGAAAARRLRRAPRRARHRRRGRRPRGRPRRRDRRAGPERGAGRRAGPRRRARRADGVVRRAGRGRRAVAGARRAGDRGPRRAPRARPHADRARPREHDRRPLRRARRGRRPRPPRHPALRPAAAHVPARALRGRAPPGRGPPAGRPGPARRRGRDGHAPLAPALRRLPRADRQRDSPTPSSRPRSPPRRATTARRRRPLVVAEGVAGLTSSPVLARSYRSYGWVQPLTAGTAAPLGDRPADRRRRPGAGRAPVARRRIGRSASPSRSSTRPSGTRPSPVGGSCSSEARRPRS